ncbi:MAG: hypothetical protein ACLQVL_09475 [Terriglobia bacterium]
MKIRRIMPGLLVIANLAALAVVGQAQSLFDSGKPYRPVASSTPAQLSLTYMRPTQGTKIRNYLFDAFGPYPLAGAAFRAGFGQATDVGQAWGHSAAGYSRRFASDLGIAATSTTTRYALSEVFKEDTLYYRCECQGVFPRLRHAVISTLTARRGEDGHRVFSFPALVAPYAGTMTAVYGWYPRRYGARDALRMGSYSMAGYVAGNIGLEFLYSGPHSLLTRMHLNNGHGAPDPDLGP